MLFLFYEYKTLETNDVSFSFYQKNFILFTLSVLPSIASNLVYAKRIVPLLVIVGVLVYTMQLQS